ncbi:MAG TPA: cytochrome c oxidase subunit 3 [Rhodopila sp.]|jgi:cytochrome c oxidase subunit 3|nr:cytochrome c oxidase subunit 3 [Rhodopila sp.]
MIVFLGVVAVIAGYWLSQQHLMAKPWLDVNAIGDVPAWGGPSVSPAKVGLGVFLTVAGCLFALLVSAYFMRVDIAATVEAGMGRGMLRGMPAPGQLWLNTGALVFSSVAMQCAQVAARHGHRQAVRDGLILGGISALVFLAGQLLVWRQLVEAGYFAASNPANAFFYLLTGIHGLHVAGGFVALGRTFTKLWHGVGIERLRLSVWLCTVYWHFLLVVWLAIFALLMGWADSFVTLCRALVT